MCNIRHMTEKHVLLLYNLRFADCKSKKYKSKMKRCDFYIEKCGFVFFMDKCEFFLTSNGYTPGSVI